MTKLHNEDLHKLYPLAGVITVMTSRMMITGGSMSTCERNGKFVPGGVWQK